jgi:antitoxin MazE
MKPKIAALTIQKWGNSLAVRIPAAIARYAHLQAGTQVEMSALEDNLIVRFVCNPKLTLSDRLKQFDPKIHGGEVMATTLIGKEKF